MFWPYHHWFGSALHADLFTYAETPRFSRLGITAPNVILPTSAREYKRVAAMKKAKLSP
ncbi:hypothetical protein E4T56_gene15063, partial [Termitomyces sp. T112]